MDFEEYCEELSKCKTIQSVALLVRKNMTLVSDAYGDVTDQDYLTPALRRVYELGVDSSKLFSTPA